MAEMKRYINRESADIKKLVGKHYEQMYVIKCNNLDDVENFLKRHKLPKQMQETKNVNSLKYMKFNLTHNTIFPQRKIHARCFPIKCYETVKEEIKPILYKFCLKMGDLHNPDSKTR